MYEQTEKKVLQFFLFYKDYLIILSNRRPFSIKFLPGITYRSGLILHSTYYCYIDKQDTGEHICVDGK